MALCFATEKGKRRMPTLSITVDGLRLPNPFIIASGPPGTNLNVIAKAFQEGWGAVIAKTVSLDASKVINVAPRYAKLFSNDKQEVVGWENIELISDRPLKIWIEEFKKCKDRFPDRVLIASIMEEYRKDAWFEIVERCQETGVDGFELNFSCPKNGVRDGRRSRDSRRGLWLGSGSSQKASLGEDDAEYYAD
jgi:dihydroorotate dehydrogenase